jgi:hypothetical protein
VAGESGGPFAHIGLLQVLLRLVLDNLAHLLGLRLKRTLKVALVEEQLIHAAEDMSQRRRQPRFYRESCARARATAQTSKRV